MKAVKVISLVLLGFLLSLSLIVFGLLFTVRMTALNASFINSRVEALDISLLIDEVIEEQAAKGELSEEFNEELQAAMVDTVDRLEPVIKERTGAVTEHIFDYLHGKTGELNLASVIRNDLLNSEFIDALLNEIDIPSLVEDVDLSALMLDFLEEQTQEDLPEDVEYLAEYVDEIVLELEPWIRQQAAIVADPIFDYILGISQSIDISISMEPVKDAFGDALKEDFLASPPADLSGLSQTELEQYFDEHFGELADELPIALEMDEEALGDLRADLTAGLADAEEAFGESREYVGHVVLSFNLLFVFILLLIAGIVLIYREVKGSCFMLSIIFIAYGVLNITAILVAKAVLRTPIEQIEGAPPSLLEWVMQTTGGALTPLLILAIVLLVIGIALLVFAIIYGRRHAGMTAEYGYISSGESEPLP